MHDSDDDLRSDDSESLTDAARRALEQLEALQSLELQHLSLRIERHMSASGPLVPAERQPDASIRLRRAA